MLKTETLTDLLRHWSAGEPGAFDALMEESYSRLRQIARRQARRERSNHTLEATGLLHEAVLRLMDLEGLEWSDRGHFFAAAAQMMRRVAVDYARQQNRLKRGGDFAKVTLSEASCLAVDGQPPDVEALDLALARLETHDPRKARIVELRFFAGLSGSEIARSLNLSTATVQREWRKARTWLYLELKGEVLGA
ncbi:MAG: sigma-70 family RNA polymerase sigma factor [Thermoanaerobaculia bacterium]|nr:sigma-70 family RNA polymerase sigma factor [Thermoanaerobaculia bacterium]